MIIFKGVKYKKYMFIIRRHTYTTRFYNQKFNETDFFDSDYYKNDNHSDKYKKDIRYRVMHDLIRKYPEMIIIFAGRSYKVLAKTSKEYSEIDTGLI